jgi:hypothetical protein
MSVSLLLEMATSNNPDRTAVVSGSTRLTTQQLSDLVGGGAGVIARANARHVVYVGTGGVMVPLLTFAAARAGLAFTRPGRGRDCAVYVGHYVAAQGCRTLAQQSDQLRHRHGRIRVGCADRRDADLRAAVPHRWD